MNVVIVGAGTAGSQLAKLLIQEKHNVALIESNPERARHASNRMDCLVVQDEGNSMSALEEAGIAKAGALVCVTDSDEMNMIICGLAESRFPGLLKIARVRNEEYAMISPTGREEEGKSGAGGPFNDFKILGIDYFVRPYVEAARWALDAIDHRAVGNIISFSGTDYELGTIDVTGGSALDGLSMLDYRGVFPPESLVTLVERAKNGGTESILPQGATVLQKGDRVSILAREDDMDRIFTLAGQAEKPLRKIGIAGGGRLGALIAGGLLAKERKNAPGVFSFLRNFIARRNRQVVIIEQDYELCKDLAVRFPGALVLNEDITDESFVAEEQLGDLDLIVTATEKQELNIITAAYLKSRGVARAITVVTSPGYAAIARQLGIDVVIPLQSVVVDTILTRVIGGGITGLHRLGEGGIGILEFETGKNAPACGKALKDCRFPEGTLVMLVNRDEKSFIPKGGDAFSPGDRIILITKNGNENEISRFFNAVSGEPPRAEIPGAAQDRGGKTP